MVKRCNAVRCLLQICTLVIIICVAEEPNFVKRGGVWVMLVAAVALLVLIIMFFIYILNVIARMPTWWCLVVSVTSVIYPCV